MPSLNDMTDDQLLARLDNHDQSLDSYGCKMLEDMLKGRAQKSPRALTERQRAWAIRMIHQLDRRAGRQEAD